MHAVNSAWNQVSRTCWWGACKREEPNLPEERQKILLVWYLLHPPEDLSPHSNPYFTDIIIPFFFVGSFPEAHPWAKSQRNGMFTGSNNCIFKTLEQVTAGSGICEASLPLLIAEEVYSSMGLQREASRQALAYINRNSNTGTCWHCKLSVV